MKILTKPSYANKQTDQTDDKSPNKIISQNKPRKTEHRFLFSS